MFLLLCYIIYRDKEKDALLEELKECWIADRKKYFDRIKPKIVEVLKLFLWLFHFCSLFLACRAIYKSTRELLRITYPM